MNGDGKPDLAIANTFSDSVSVLLNTTAPGATAPSYASQATFATGSNPRSVSIGDLNGDGKPDLAIANYSSHSVSVLVNTTAPGATAPSYAAQATLATGFYPFSVSIGDLNGDGKPDLAIANYLRSISSVLLNTTAPGSTAASYAPQATFYVGGGDPMAVAIGDLNDDGKLDLAFAIPYGNYTAQFVSVLLSTTAPGATTPSYSPETTFAAGNNPASVSIGDLNGDGKPDLAIANLGSNSVSVLLNTTAPGATTPSYAAQAAFATGTRPVSVSIGDLNGDGKPDLAIANRDSSSVSVLLNATASGNLTVSSATGTTFAAVVGGTTPLSSVTIASGPTSLGGNVTTLGTQSYTGLVTLTADTTLTGTTLTLGDGVDRAGYTLTLNFNNKAPTDIGLSATSVPENASADTVVGTFFTTDADQSDTFTYALVAGSGSTDNAAFTIDGSQFKTVTAFDFETRSSYSIRVRSTDPNGLSTEKTFTITVTDVNEALAFTSGSTGSVAENAPTGTVIYTAVATDIDSSAPNNTVLYSLKPGAGDAQMVAINATSGEVTLLAAANAALKSTYAFTVVATDGGSPALAAEKAVTVSVTSVNAFAPVFTSGTTGVVGEGAPTTSVIYTAVATDADTSVPNNAVSYRIVPNLFDAALVSIDPTTGRVTLLAAADLRVKSSYEFVVVASDGGTPVLSAQQGVKVTVIERNQFAPVFTSGPTGTVAEMSPTSTVIYTAAATDADSTAPNNTVSYSIKPDVGDASLVSIEAATGKVRLLASADFETKPVYTFTVVATDGGNPSLATELPVTVAVTNVPPVATAVAIAPRGYKAGATIVVSVTFSEPVLVTGAAQIGLTVGTTLRQAVYTGGSGTQTLQFSYVVAAGENDSDGVAVAQSIVLGGATIRDGAGADASITLPLASTDGAVVDTIPPLLQAATGPSPGTYASGQKLSFTVTFNEPMTVTGVPYLDLKVNNIARKAVYDSGAGTNKLVFSYTVAVGETAAARKVVATGRSIQLPAGAAVTDLAGNPPVSLAYTPPGTSGVKVDGVVPVAASVTVPAAKIYRTGQPLVFKVNYSRAVFVNGVPQLTVSIGQSFRQAVYISGSGTKSLSFRYVVAAGDLSVQGVVLSSTVALNSGWIRDAVGNPARLTLPAVNTRNVLVDAVPPSVTGLTTPAATYKKGQTLSFTVTFTEAVLVTGVPRLQAVIGTTVRSITYVRGTGTKSLVFSYKIQATDKDADGIALQSQIVLGTGTIRDRGGNPTILTLPSIDTSGVKVS